MDLVQQPHLARVLLLLLQGQGCVVATDDECATTIRHFHSFLPPLPICAVLCISKLIIVQRDALGATVASATFVLLLCSEEGFQAFRGLVAMVFP